MAGTPDTPDAPYWSIPEAALLTRLRADLSGLSAPEAAIRRAQSPHEAEPSRVARTLRLLFAQFKSPIILILLFAAALSFFLGDHSDDFMIVGIVLASGLLGFWQEHSASDAVAKLLRLIEVRVNVRRAGALVKVALEDVVPGDIVLLSAGAIIPGDCRLLEARDFFVDEAALTGESYPAEKQVGVVAVGAALGARTCALHMGTHVMSGTATAVVVSVGTDTELGKISHRLRLRATETEFERGIRRFGYLLLEVTLVLVIGIFAINVYLHHRMFEALMFSLALAVGLTPQLLPAIISVNLAHGARSMAAAKVIVRRLSSIENFGSMDVLCSDKTGTLTEGTVTLSAAVAPDGSDSQRAWLYARLNAAFESGFANPIDEAIRKSGGLELGGWAKLDEAPYDFIRKRLSVLVSREAETLLLTKGAVPRVLEVCSHAELVDGKQQPLASLRAQIDEAVQRAANRGMRAIAVACKPMPGKAQASKADESEMTLVGLLFFEDPPKTGIAQTVDRLRKLGVQLKVITGDHALVAAYVGEKIGLYTQRILTGADLRTLSDEALVRSVEEVQLFAEIEPNQKERIIIALKKAGHVVGYMGDGINDASAIHAADVGISVDSAVDVAKAAADLVLLEHDLEVLVKGVELGRVTFTNTLKYVFMATSANFGNMFSMAGASLFLPFLPLLPQQVLLTNLLTDIPEMTIARDAVDPEAVAVPRRWDVAFIRRFMVVFGLLSSVFDYATFGVLRWLGASPAVFRSGWFVESVLSASLIVLVVRTRRPFVRSRPGRALLLTTLGTVVVTALIPFSLGAERLGFAPVPGRFLAALGVIIVLYMASAELAKRWFFKHEISRLHPLLPRP